MFIDKKIIWNVFFSDFIHWIDHIAFKFLKHFA